MTEEMELTVPTEESFHERIQRLVAEAAANGIDVEGSWPIVNGGSEPSWDLEITQLVQEDEKEEPANAERIDSSHD